MADKSALWRRLKIKHSLHADLEVAANWSFASGFLSIGHDLHSSTVKIRKAGFQSCVDSEDRLFELFDALVTRKVIPLPTAMY